MTPPTGIPALDALLAQAASPSARNIRWCPKCPGMTQINLSYEPCPMCDGPTYVRRVIDEADMGRAIEALAAECRRLVEENAALADLNDLLSLSERSVQYDEVGAKDAVDRARKRLDALRGARGGQDK